MRFVLANRHLVATGGTEVHLATFGEHLVRLGHEVTLYAPQLGAFAEHARTRGLATAGELDALPADCDVIFCQDAIVVHELAERYPQALCVFRICGDVHDFQLPPQVGGIVDLVVVLSDRYERIARAAAVQVPILRLRAPIDIDRLVPIGQIRERPRRAVLLGNYDARAEIVEATWSSLGVEVQRVGGALERYDVAAAVADADIVVAKSRAALDAMACGRAVYVYDVFGGDGWVTPEGYAALEADMFAGQATDRVIDADVLASDLAGYAASMGVANRDLVLQHHSARDHVVAFVGAISEHAPGERPHAPAPLRELSRLVALQSSWEVTAREFRAMHWMMRDELARQEQAAYAAHHAAAAAAARAEHAEARAEHAEARAGHVEAQLAQIRASRAWRLACRFYDMRRALR
ncbi:MAG: hypothetical protein QOI73_570 [Solirubrobacteraceae bacterium]|nr:hypothetical protein [Solirubrobacteraceae bacterium]